MAEMDTSAVILDGSAVNVVAHLLAGGEVVAAQQAEGCLWSPEKALAAAVLGNALTEIRDHAGNPKRRAVIAEELDWVRSDAVDHCFTFLRLCEVLHLDAQWVRETVAGWHAEGRRRRARYNWRVAA